MEFSTVSSPTPLSLLVQKLTEMAKEKKRTVVLAGRGKRLAVESHQDEMSALLSDGSVHATLGHEMRQTIGDVSTSLVVSGVAAGVLVMQTSLAAETAAV